MPFLLRRLVKAYGPRPPRRWGNAVSVLVETILSQNTNNANSNAGFRRLRRRLRTWDAVADAPAEQVEAAIRVSGLSRIKAPRIQAILRQIRQERGRITLEFLERMPPDEAIAYLSAFDGIGPKTARCVLLFAFASPVFPVDTHIHRIAQRLGLIDAKCSADEAHERLTAMIRPDDRYAMHLLLIEHGRRVCRAGNPQCDECILKDLCPSRRRGWRRVRRRADQTP